MLTLQFMNLLAWHFDLRTEAESRRVILFSISVRGRAYFLYICV